ncbi:DUF6090 family protein [Allomuricauda sp. NBRC 101325]|uniref:DUF6090 family protein n=1 Tax=Allomuricauda sp. NBRC 101325 TaxID=1113758 RepID=UPI0024A51AF7|nr:DUF6090 family protein [Muricauda sp. NBRC 101325]GLU45333.1 hypothetical protein Musp01_29570 [Muricauda sp. NBRC 101325]
MFKFFRDIRQQLIVEGKMGKYLKYAIGEIVLVVLGILIALQINNWNENKNRRSFEIEMLREVEQALLQDYIFFTDHLMGYRNKTELDAVSFFDRAIVSNQVIKDSMDYYFNRLDFGLRVTYNRGPYDALKASGMDKISNDEIRNKLMQFYDFYLPRYEGLIDFEKASSREKMNPLIEKLSIAAPIQIVGENVVRTNAHLKDINLRNDEDFNKLLFLVKQRAVNIKGVLELLSNYMLQLTKLLEKELQNEQP